MSTETQDIAPQESSEVPAEETPAAVAEASQAPNASPDTPNVAGLPLVSTTQDVLGGMFGRRRGVQKLPDGSLRLEVVISPESAALLIGWAETANMPLEEYLQQTVDESLLAYVGQQAS